MVAHIDTRASLTIEPMIFPRQEWETYGEHETQGFRPVPGTWCPRWHGAPAWLLAMYCCPSCKQALVLHRNVHSIDGFGKVSPSLHCSMSNCDFHRNAYFDRWNDKPLYACAIQRRQAKSLGGFGPIEMIYCHASTQEEARIHIGPGDYYIVGIGPAIGYFVEDVNGEKLSVD